MIQYPFGSILTTKPFGMGSTIQSVVSQGLKDCDFEGNQGPRSKKLASKQGRLVMALILKESSNKPCVEPGDGGRALGCLQIHRSYWEDAQNQRRREQGITPNPPTGGSTYGEYIDLTCREGWFHLNACNYSKCILHYYMRRWAKKKWTDENEFSPATVSTIHRLGGPRAKEGPPWPILVPTMEDYLKEVQENGNYTDEEFGTVEWDSI